MILSCGHEAIDREKMRAYHGATELWCPVCKTWETADIIDTPTLFDQDRINRPRREER
jgi:hypothetical protein